MESQPGMHRSSHPGNFLLINASTIAQMQSETDCFWSKAIVNRNFKNWQCYLNTIKSIIKVFIWEINLESYLRK